MKWMGNPKGVAGGTLVLMLGGMVLCTTAFADSSWTITQLTDNSVIDAQPDISGTNVVWRRGSNEIWSNFSAVQLGTGVNPAVSGNEAVWQSNLAGGWQIWSNLRGQMTATASPNYAPDISGNKVVWWSSDGSDYEIFTNFGTGQLSNNSVRDEAPAISGSYVVWQGTGPYGGDNVEIYSNFGWSTDNGHINSYPAISGTNVVWENSINGGTMSWEIWGYINGEIVQLTNNDTRDCRPDISGTNVVWQAWDGTDWEIFSNLGFRTDNTVDDVSPAISGRTIVWSGSDGYDYEIYMAQPVPVPAAVLLGMLGLSVAGLKLRRHA